MAVDGAAIAYQPGTWTLTETDRGEQTVVVTYAVKVTSALDGPIVARGASGLPARHATYSLGNDSSTLLFCTDRSWRKDTTTANLWICECTFSTLTGERDDNGTPTDDPTQWRTRYEILFSQRQRDVTKAKFIQFDNGNHLLVIAANDNNVENGPIINAAGDPIEPVPQMDDSRMHIRATFYEAQADVERYSDYRNAVNSDAFSVTRTDAITGAVVWSKQFQPDQCKMMSVGLTDEEINGTTYARVSLEFAYDEDGWELVIPHKGMMRRGCAGDPDGLGSTIDATDEVAGAKRAQQIYDKLGGVSTHPTLLDDSGQPLDCDEDPVNMIWEVYPRLPFAILGI